MYKMELERLYTTTATTDALHFIIPNGMLDRNISVTESNHIIERERVRDIDKQYPSNNTTEQYIKRI